MNYKKCPIKQGHQPHIWGDGLVMYECPGRASRTPARPEKEEKKK